MACGSQSVLAGSHPCRRRRHMSRKATWLTDGPQTCQRDSCYPMGAVLRCRFMVPSVPGRLLYSRVPGRQIRLTPRRAPTVGTYPSPQISPDSSPRNGRRLSMAQEPGTTTPRRAHRSIACSSGKRRYRDHQHAVEALHSAQSVAARELAEQGSTRRAEHRTYACWNCRGWHLTSQHRFAEGSTTPASPLETATTVVSVDGGAR